MQKVYDEAYERDLCAHFDALLPEKIYDAHFHLSRAYIERIGYDGEPFKQYDEFMEKYIVRKVCGGMVMPQPSSKHTPEQVDDENAYNLKVAAEHNLAAGLIVPPYYGRAKAEQMLDTYPQIKVLKPYLTYSAADDMFEADLLDFAPTWIWELANDRKLPVLIHLSHYQNMLNDERNIEQLRFVSEAYPNAKIVLAHCAMGHHTRKLKLGLEKIKDLKNIWFDCSGSAEALSIYYCLKTFGVDRMMYGGDHDHGANVGRICSFGSNFIGFHVGYLNDDALPPDYRYQPLNNAQECLLALLDACELMEFGAAEREKIFYSNAAALYA